MPLIQIHLMKGKSPKYMKAVADGVQKALTVAWKFKIGRFQIIHEHDKRHFYIDKSFGGVRRSDNTIIIHITTLKLSNEKKRRTYRELVKVLTKNPKVKKEDVYVVIVANDPASWSVGNGVAYGD